MARRPGAKRERVTIQANSPTQGPGGGLVDNWAPIPKTPTVWAEIEPRAGREKTRGGELAESFDFRVWLYWRPDVDGQMRLLWGSADPAEARILYIISPPANPDMKRQDLLLECREGIPR